MAQGSNWPYRCSYAPIQSVAPPLAPKKRLYFNDLVNTILNEEKGCRRQGTTLGCLCLYNAPHPAQPWVERDISGAINDVGRLRHTSHLCWYLVHAPFTCSHTYNLFSLLNFADLSCDCEEFSAVKGLRSARWIWSRNSDKEAGWLSFLSL